MKRFILKIDTKKWKYDKSGMTKPFLRHRVMQSPKIALFWRFPVDSVANCSQHKGHRRTSREKGIAFVPQQDYQVKRSHNTMTTIAIQYSRKLISYRIYLIFNFFLVSRNSHVSCRIKFVDYRTVPNFNFVRSKIYKVKSGRIRIYKYM